MFVISAACAGLAGAIKTLVLGFATLSDVHWTMSDTVILMTLIGGLGARPTGGRRVIVVALEMCRVRSQARWLDRLMLGQMALTLAREHLGASHAVRRSDALTLFTNELTLNYQNPLVRHIFQRCSDALKVGSYRAGP